MVSTATHKGAKMLNSSLKSFAERLVRLAAEKAEIKAMQDEVRDEAKAAGFDAALLAKVVKRLAMDEAKRAKARAQDDLFDSYMVAVGLADTPDLPTDLERGECITEIEPEKNAAEAFTSGFEECHVSRATARAVAAGMGGPDIAS